MKKLIIAVLALVSGMSLQAKFESQAQYNKRKAAAQRVADARKGRPVLRKRRKKRAGYRPVENQSRRRPAAKVVPQSRLYNPVRSSTRNRRPRRGQRVQHRESRAQRVARIRREASIDNRYSHGRNRQYANYSSNRSGNQLSRARDVSYLGHNQSANDLRPVRRRSYDTDYYSGHSDNSQNLPLADASLVHSLQFVSDNDGHYFMVPNEYLQYVTNGAMDMTLFPRVRVINYDGTVSDLFRPLNQGVYTFLTDDNSNAIFMVPSEYAGHVPDSLNSYPRLLAPLGSNRHYLSSGPMPLDRHIGPNGELNMQGIINEGIDWSLRNNGSVPERVFVHTPASNPFVSSGYRLGGNPGFNRLGGNVGPSRNFQSFDIYNVGSGDNNSIDENIVRQIQLDSFGNSLPDISQEQVDFIEKQAKDNEDAVVSNLVGFTTSLHKAVKENSVEKVKASLKLLDCPVCDEGKVFFKVCRGTINEDEESAIHKLCYTCYERTNPKQCPICRDYMLHASQVEQNVFGGLDLYDENGFTALHLAERNGYTNIAKLLIEAGADSSLQVKIPDYQVITWENTEFQDAVVDNDIEKVRSLIIKANQDCKNRALNLMSYYPESHKEMADLIGSFGGELSIDILKVLIELPHYDKITYLVPHASQQTKDEALLFACKHGYADSVEILLKAGADNDKYDEDENNPFMFAVERNNTDILKLFVNSMDRETILKSLYKKIFYNNIAYVKAFIENSTDDLVNATYNRRAPLHVAATSGHADIVKYLLGQGATVDAKNDDGKTAFDLAKEKGFDECCELLQVKNDSSALNDPDENNRIMQLYAYIRQDNVDKVTELINKVPYEKQIKALSIAAVSHGGSLLSIFSELIGADGMKEEFFKAIYYGQLESVQAFVEQVNVDINGKMHNDFTPLHQAVVFGKYNIVKYLLEQGADISVQTLNGVTAFDLAQKNNELEIARLLENWVQGDSLPIEQDNQIHSDFENTTNKTKEWYFSSCISTGRIDLNQPLVAGFTALHKAVTSDQPEVVQFLLEQGADINAKTDTGFTALHFAAKNGHHALVELLMKQDGIRTDITNNDGKTAFDLLHDESSDTFDGSRLKVSPKRLSASLKQKNLDCAWYASYHLACLVEGKIPSKKEFDRHFTQSINEQGGDVQSSEFIYDLIQNTEILSVLKGPGSKPLAKNVHVIDDAANFVNYFKHRSGKERIPNLYNLYKGIEEFRMPGDTPQFILLRLSSKHEMDQGDTLKSFQKRAHETSSSHWIAVKLSKKGGDIAFDFYDSLPSKSSSYRDEFRYLRDIFTGISLKKLKLTEKMTALIASKDRCQRIRCIGKAFKDNNKDLLESFAELLTAKTINIPIKKGYTFLHVASWYGNTSIVRYLIARGADVNIKDKEGNVALVLAAQQGHLQNVKALVRKSNQEYCGTAFVAAVIAGHLEIVKYLSSEAHKPIAENHAQTFLDQALEATSHASVKGYLQVLKAKKSFDMKQMLRKERRRHQRSVKKNRYQPKR